MKYIIYNLGNFHVKNYLCDTFISWIKGTYENILTLKKFKSSLALIQSHDELQG